MHQGQFDNVVKLSGLDRYQHFVARISDWEELWSLKNSQGFVSFSDGEGKEGIPFWPHPDYAKSIATGDWDDCSPERIELKVFLERWLPGMKNDGVFAVVFPTPEEKGMMIDPDQLGTDIREECKQYE